MTAPLEVLKVSHTCKVCGETKPAGDMLTRKGKTCATCKACYAAAIAAGRNKSPGGVAR